MADNTKLQYIVELLTQGDTKKATEELKKLGAAGSGAATSMDSLKSGALAAFAALGGVSFIRQSIEAFLEQERAVAKLNAALRSTGQLTPELTEEMVALSESLAQVSTYADDAILNVIAKLTAAGAKREDIARLTQAVLDLSTLMDRDLNRATQAFTMALNGEVTALKAAGVQIDETRTATEQFNSALEQIEKKAGGQAKEAIQGLSGEVNQLAKDWDSASEAVGGFFLKMYSAFRSVPEDVRNFFRSSGAKDPQAVLTGPDELRYPRPLSDASNAALLALMGTQGARPVTTAGLSLQDELAALEEMAKLEDEIVKQVNAEADSRQLVAQLVDEQIANELSAFQNGERIKQDLIDQTVLTMLEGDARVQAEIEINHDRRLRMIEEQEFYDQEQKDAAIRAVQALAEEERRKFEQSRTYSFQLQKDMKQVAESGAQAFSSGLATAIVDAFEEGDKAFQKFAANFLRQIAEMILQALILRAIKGAFGLADGGQVTAMANGGMIYAANGVSGVMDVSSPTYFPKFNVLAGEAGREVMTVLSRPRFERINGVPAQIGYAGGNRLAITSADALARGGGGAAGGNIVIEVRYSKDTEVRVLEQSVQNARVAIVQDMSSDSQLSRVTRQKVS